MLFLCLIPGIAEDVDDETQMFIPLIPTILIIGIVWKIKHRGIKENTKTYKELYKEKIVDPIINNCFPTCNYYPFKGLPQEEYNEMGYNEEYNVYKADDLIETEMSTKDGNKILLKLSDLFVAKNVENRIEYIFFKGIIGHIKIEKHIPSYIRITTKSNIDKESQVLMDSTEFEKYFDVESTDKIMSMQILTSDIMLNIIDIWNKTNVKFDVTLRNNNINLRFFTGNMFESSIDELKFERKRSLEKYYDILEFVKNISIQIYDAISESNI